MSLICNSIFIAIKFIAFIAIAFINYKTDDKPNDSVHYIAVGNIAYMNNSLEITKSIFDEICVYVDE